MKDKLQGSRKKNSHIGIVGVVASVITVVAVISAFWTAWARREPGIHPTIASPAAGGRGIVVMPDNVEELLAQQEVPVEDGHYRSRMNTDWVFPGSGGPSANAYVENPAGNTRTVFFDLFLQDTMELVYTSPFIPVGAKLENFALDAHVPAGRYRGIVTYRLVDDNFEEITTVSVAVNLHILE